MDRPSQEPLEPEPRDDAAPSPLSFPVEAPRPEGVEPGAGTPFGFPTAAPADAQPLSFPAEASTAPADAQPLSFPVEAPRPDGLEPGAGTPADAFPAARPPSFPNAQPLPFADARPPADAFPQPPEFPNPQPLPFPVAQLPGAPAQPEPVPEPLPEPRPPATRLPALLASLAALLTVGGLFLPLFRLQQQIGVRQRFLDARLTVSQTAWGIQFDFPGQEIDDRPAAPVGIPLVVAVLLLAVAALTAFSRPDRALSRWLVGAGAVFATGVVATVGMIGLEFDAIAEPDADTEVGVGLGMWLLVLAVLAAVAAAVVAYLPRWRSAEWADPELAYRDTPTPPTGVAITVLPPEEPEKPE
ncbi:hypothetical protein M8542_20580 [Amycolatopsis sp. OK19-0408]|uniref:Uncharacterized protein n=1 Tax=Amycolatopsis iheyensis TaxID=2945988 RepID=A0A9X2SKK5_9PSEU|nr:hypothetical protein [Amycolatopsis iheyensis]MCR6485228.1 hypothetical protein [Amycolatopsis iheyensis]